MAILDGAEAAVFGILRNECGGFFRKYPSCKSELDLGLCLDCFFRVTFRGEASTNPHS
jgi:hypothetical protein